ncbi:MAG: DNA repair protein RecO [Candidatus Coproplasma sp.]
MAEIKVNALMLRAVDYRENDKILTLLSAERGRITAGIKGVKKANAKLKFAAQPFCFAEYILAERGGRYTVTQASECESFYELRCDVDKYYAACAVCEAAINLTEEGDGGGEIFALCIKALRDMCVSDQKTALISFLLSALKVCGYGISVSQFCPDCGNRIDGAEKLRFDLRSGTFTCWDCSSFVGVSGQTFKALLIAEGKMSGEAAEEGKIRALKLLREYMVNKLDARCVCLTDYINLI